MDVVIEAEMADPLGAPVLGSFAGAIDSVVKVVMSLAAVRKSGWHLTGGAVNLVPRASALTFLL
jgi:hypothetical protein